MLAHDYERSQIKWRLVKKSDKATITHKLVIKATLSLASPNFDMYPTLFEIGSDYEKS